MNPALTLTGWVQLLGLLGAEVVVVITLAVLLQKFTKSAMWRRTIWQVATLALLALVACELSGLSRSIIGWATANTETRPTTSFQLREESPPAAILAEPEIDEGAKTPIVAPIHFAKPPPPPTFTWWPGMVWLLGTVLVVGWTALARLWFVLCGRRRRVVNDGPWSARVQSLARRLRIRRRIRLTESSDLSGPIAFGILRPAISLPEGFRKNFTEAQQDAMLVHELAHLAAHDPVWYWLADTATALLWWHPLAWWFRRQLHAASEAAADEASLLIENGPQVLAECLVDLGRRLTQPQSSGWLGIEGSGFRSGLGRRVKRLVTLRGQPWQPMRRTSAWLVKTVGPLALVAMVLASTAWTQPRSAEHGTLSQALRQSVLGLAFSAALPDEPVRRAAGPSLSKGSELLQQQPAVTNEPFSKDTLVHPTNPPKAVVAGASETNSASNSNATGSDRGREALVRKLDSIVLDEVAFNGQPLGEVVATLARLAKARDPEGRGVNFIIAPGAPLTNAIVRLQPALSSITLGQALDAVIKCANLPLRFSVEAYAVVITLKSPEPVALHTRWYKIDPDTFLHARPSKTNQDFDSSSLATTTWQQRINAIARDLFTAAGVDFGPLPSSGPGAAAGPGNGKSLFFNERTGILMVRATLQDLDIIEQAISALTPRPQPGSEKQRPSEELDLNQLLRKAIGAGESETNSPSKSSATGRGRGREALARKLDAIVLDEVVFDGQPLGEVIKRLHAQASIEHPEGQSVNFILASADLRNVMISVQPSLRKVTLRKALDAVVESASPPLRHSVEDYAVVITLKTPAITNLYTRWFKVDPDTFLKNLRSVTTYDFGNGNSSQAYVTLGSAKNVNQPDAGRNIYTRPASQHSVVDAARDFFAAAGVDFGQPPGVGPSDDSLLAGALASPPGNGKALFFKDRTGILMVRATLQDLDIIEKAVQALNTAPPQLTIEVKVAEITDEDAKALGFNWLPASATNGVSSGEKTSSTNRITFATAGILTDPQFRVVIRALEQRVGVDLLSMPKVTTLSGLKTQLKSTDVRNAVIEYQSVDFLIRGEAKVVSNVFVKPFEFGPVVVVPSVAADGYTIQLAVTSSSKEFIGYETPKPHLDSSIGATPSPVFRHRQFSGSGNVYDGQTLVLHGGSFTNSLRLADKVAVLGDMPLLGRFYRSEASKAAKRSLLIFVTPRLVDPAGHPLHDDEDLRKYFYKIPPEQSKRDRP